MTRQTSYHLYWDCPHFQATRKPYFEKFTDIRNKLMVADAWLLREFDLLVGTHAWRCCGVANETCAAIAGYTAKCQPAYVLSTTNATQLITGEGEGLNWLVCPTNDRHYVKVYPDGSLIDGDTLWRARAAWGIWVGPGNPANDSGGSALRVLAEPSSLQFWK